MVEPTPTDGLELHDVALDIGLAINHSTYDTLYLAFAVAMGARAVVVADAMFVRPVDVGGQQHWLVAIEAGDVVLRRF